MNALDVAIEELRREGYEVLSHLHLGPADVSCCVVGPTGVFAIEPDDEDQDEVVDEAHRVERLLWAAGLSQHVEPVVAEDPTQVVDAVHHGCSKLREETIDQIRHVLSLYRHNRRSA